MLLTRSLDVDSPASRSHKKCLQGQFSGATLLLAGIGQTGHSLYCSYQELGFTGVDKLTLTLSLSDSTL